MLSLEQVIQGLIETNFLKDQIEDYFWGQIDLVFNHKIFAITFLEPTESTWSLLLNAMQNEASEQAIKVSKCS